MTLQTAGTEGTASALTMLKDGTVRLVLEREGDESPALSDDPEWVRVGTALQSKVQKLGGGFRIEGSECVVWFDPVHGACRVRDGRGRVTWSVGWRQLSTEGGWSLEGEIPKGGHLYGTGERTGEMDKRGSRVYMWSQGIAPYLPDTDPLHLSIPFVLTIAEGIAAGLFVADAGRMRWDLGATDPGRWSMDGDGSRVEVFFIPGPEPRDVLERFTRLTGRSALFPAWALGYHQSRHSYRDAEEVRELVWEFRRRGIPLDAVYLDIDYMDEFHPFTTDPTRYPDLPGLTRDLESLHVRLVPILNPGVSADPKDPLHKDGARREAFVCDREGRPVVGRLWVGAAVFPDFLRADVRQWWASLHKSFVEGGVGGIWVDMNEPAWLPGAGPPAQKTRPGEPHTRTLPDDAVQRWQGQQVRHGAVHNLYGSAMVQATWQGLQGLRPGERPFVLARASFAGVGRYAAIWTGDNSSWWEHLRGTIPMLVNLSLSGVYLVGVDVGGFRGSPSAELFLRWMQLGAFLPFFRNHTAKGTARQEPWAFGEDIERLVGAAIRTRYALLPFWYSLMREAHDEGVPMMRPLWWGAPGDERAHEVDDEFLIGEALLVAPVVEPRCSERLVYLPPGRWFNWPEPGSTFEGGRSYIVPTPLGSIPVFVRAGSVVPMAPAREWADISSVELQVTMGDSGQGMVHMDDGRSPEGAAFRKISAHWHERSNDGTLTFSEEGNYPGWPQAVTFRNAPVSRPVEAFVDGTQVAVERGGTDRAMRVELAGPCRQLHLAWSR